MDSYSYHITKWDPQPIVGGSWARVHPDPLNYNSYKLHGYPPGFQKKSKSIAVANQVSSSSSALPKTTDGSQNFSSLAMQCQQLLNMFNAQA